MNAKKLLLVLLMLASAGCEGHRNDKKYMQISVDNPVYRANVIFHAEEDLHSPRFANLRRKYHLDDVVQGEISEFKRILLLRHWIKSTISIDNNQKSNKGDYNPEYILDMAMTGAGFQCAQFRIVQNAVMNAFGYVARTLGAGPGERGGPDGHHGINEIWSNDYHKWFLSDAKYDWHFEKHGIPLSALEVRDEYLRNKAADIVRVKGPERMPIEIDPSTGSSADTARSARTYTWIEWDAWNDVLTSWPDHKLLLYVYEDDYARNHTWIWGGKPHWAYHTRYLKMITDRDALEWTPNTIASRVRIEGARATIALTSATPNFKEYQMRDSAAAGGWQKVGDKVRIDLVHKRYDLVFRTVNLAGVPGPEHRVVLVAVQT